MIDYIIDFIYYIKYSRMSFLRKVLITLLFMVAVLVSLCMILFTALLWIVLLLLRSLMMFVKLCGICIAVIGFLLFAVCIILIISSGDSFLAHLDALGSLLLVVFIPLCITVIEELIDYMIDKMIDIADKRYVLLDKVLKM
ncbi:hypothetical protein [Thomasclavelia cocleata]|uniref:hypothetical protein n=1 Tax=Thomasclavelia cocleata TaxID=69824 RepID=UPI00242D4B28|nr:hypothetical protein [Thomasclavelia cocleata]